MINDILFLLTNAQITALFNNLANSRFTFCIVTTMNNSFNGRRKLEPKHSYANVNIRLAPFSRNLFLRSLPRPRSANEDMKDLGEFLVYDKGAFYSPQRDVPTSHSPLKARWGRQCRRDGR